MFNYDFYFKYWDSLYPEIKDIDKRLESLRWKLRSFALRSNKIYIKQVRLEIHYLKEYKTYRLTKMKQLSFDLDTGEIQ